MGKLYTIGEMAKLGNISVKALRFYDQEGLIQPEKRDTQTGYRYYSDKQLLELLIVKELKPFGLSLSDIKILLKDYKLLPLRTRLEKRIREYKESIVELEKKLEITYEGFERIVNAIETLEKYNENLGDTVREIKLEEMKSVPVLYTRYQSYCNVGKLFLDRHIELHKLKEEKGLCAVGPLKAIFHDHYTNQFFSNTGDLELCLPIKVQEDRVNERIRLLEGFQVATTIHIGKYTDLLETYVKLVNWINENNFVINGPAMEEYIIGPIDTQFEGEYLTKVILPVERLA